MTEKAQALLSDEAPITEREELLDLVARGQEQGYLTIEEIAARLDEVEVTKEQVSELHAHLVEQGIDVVAEDGRPPAAATPKEESAARETETAARATPSFRAAR